MNGFDTKTFLKNFETKKMEMKIEQRVNQGYAAVMSPFATPEIIKAELEGLVKFGIDLMKPKSNPEEKKNIITWDVLQEKSEYWRGKR